jgi:uncharacterized small protein (DUF1192 family)
MDSAVVTETLNSTLQRIGRLVHSYEVEIANLTAEVYRLKAQVQEFEDALAKANEEK